jgi:hypothetical protein
MCCSLVNGVPLEGSRGVAAWGRALEFTAGAPDASKNPARPVFRRHRVCDTEGFYGLARHFGEDATPAGCDTLLQA